MNVIDAKLKKVSLSLPFGIGSAEWEVTKTESKAAWELYIELVTRLAVTLVWLCVWAALVWAAALRWGNWWCQKGTRCGRTLQPMATYIELS